MRCQVLGTPKFGPQRFCVVGGCCTHLWRGVYLLDRLPGFAQPRSLGRLDWAERQFLERAGLLARPTPAMHAIST